MNTRHVHVNVSVAWLMLAACGGRTGHAVHTSVFAHYAAGFEVSDPRTSVGGVRALGWPCV
jgi:hypothetical protein